MKKLCILQQGCAWHEMEFRKICNSLAGSYELTDFPHKADLIIQYFCSVTRIELSQVIEELAYLKKVKPPKTMLIVCGCAVHSLGKEAFESLDFVDFAIGRSNIAENVLKILKQPMKEGYFFERCKSDVTLNVVDGCKKKNGWCTFCKQNYMRIPVKSMPMDEVLNQAKELSENHGIYRFSLGGLNICNYGIDMLDGKPKLHTLIRKITELPKVEIVDLYGLTIESLYDELAEEIATNPKVCILELGIQSGSESMLKIMNTGATLNDVQKYLDAFEHKVLKSIVVIGHPGETEEYFKETVEFIIKNNLWYIQISGFINTPDTPASKMQQLPSEVINQRVKELVEVKEELTKKFLDSLVGQTITSVSRVDVSRENGAVFLFFNYKSSELDICVVLTGDEIEKFNHLITDDSIRRGVKIKIKSVIQYDNPLLEATFEE